jgi:hypothetical protein
MQEREVPEAFFDRGEQYWGASEVAEPAPHIRLGPAQRRRASRLVSGVFREFLRGAAGRMLPEGAFLYPYEPAYISHAHGGALPDTVLLLTTEHMRPATAQERARAAATPRLPYTEPPDFNPRRLIEAGAERHRKHTDYTPATWEAMSSDGTHHYELSSTLVCMVAASRRRVVPLQLMGATVYDDPNQTVGVMVKHMGPEWRPGAIGTSYIDYKGDDFQQAFRTVSAEVLQEGNL